VTDLQLVVNGREYRTLDAVPEELRRHVALALASMSLSSEQLRGERRIVVNVSRKARRSAPPQARPEEPESLLGSDDDDERPSYATPARQTQDGPMLGPGDPSPLSKKLLGAFLGFLAAVLFTRLFSR
jgi:hypothetical protein